MSKEESRELFGEYRNAFAPRLRHRLLFLLSTFGAGLWCLAPVFWAEEEPAWWFFVLSLGPIAAYLAFMIPRRHRVLKDMRFSRLRGSLSLLTQAELRLIWPSDEEAGAFPWLRDRRPRSL